MTNSAHNHHHDGDDLHDRGLQFDLQTLMRRRHALKLFGGAAAMLLVGCDSDDNPPASGNTPVTGANTPAGSSGGGTTSTTTPATTIVSPIPTGTTPASACTAALPSETAGPFPGDGSNGPNALTQSGIVRTDIRASLGGGNTASGVPLNFVLTVVDTKNSCAPIAGAALYLWHCDVQGRYSMYSQGVTNETYLRGVQAADANGVVRFSSIFPGAYDGRWPHVHFEVYPNLTSANSSRNARATSQLALPEAICRTVYGTSGYEQSLTNLARTPLASDNVFRDGWDLQMATVSGNASSGYTAALTVGV